MTIKKLYISGPISHYPDENRQAFDLAEIRLKAAGYEPLNPFISPLNDPHYPDKSSTTFAQYLREDLKMVLEADGIAILPGAQWSKGSRLEVDTAMGLSMPVLEVGQWLQLADYWKRGGVAAATENQIMKLVYPNDPTMHHIYGNQFQEELV